MTIFSKWVTSFNVDHASFHHQSILGENYNESFRRRMSDRKSRRNHFSQVDGKLVSEGAVGANVCSPFKALYTPVSLVNVF